MTAKWAVSVLALLLFSSLVAEAAPRTDVVTLANGDRITGEIVSLSLGRLTFKTDDAGTIEIEWEKLAHVESVQQFEVITSDGRRMLGHLGRADAGREVLVVTLSGSVSLPVAEVTNLTPIGASFWAKLDGSVDAGFNYTRSSGIAQTTFNSDTIFRRPAFMMRLSSSATLTQRSDDDQRDDRAALDFSYERFRGRRWFIVGAGRLESNESLGLVLRSQLGTALGLRLVNTNRAQIAVSGGLVVNNEQGVDTPAAQNVEALFGARMSYYSYDRPKTTLDAGLQYYPSLSHWGRQRIQVDSNVKRELWKDFYVALNLFDTFDTDPPNVDAARNDVGVVASVGWSY